MALPKEPRGLMINLMYLVLTAMLALNVSSEILHAFRTINNSITHSNSSIGDKNNETLVAFQANEEMDGQKERVKPYNDKAKAIHAEADQMYAYLDEWKSRIIEATGGYIDTLTHTLKNESDFDASTRMLVEKKGGDTIKQRLSALKATMLNSLTSEEARVSLGKELPIQIVEPEKSDNNPQADWSTGNFYNMPTLAAVTLFSKMQNDVRNSEAMVLERLFQEASAKQIKFDAITAIAVPQTSYALVGQPVKAQIMLAAYNKSVIPEVSPSSGRIVKKENGIADWEGVAAGVGLQTVRGQLSVNLGERKITEPWEFQYMVGSAGASLQLDAMNVFYAGIDNPISVTAAGYSLEDVAVSIPGANLVPTGKGKYTVKVPPTSPTVTASVSVKTAQGMKQIATYPIRVLRIPNPEAQIGGKTQGVMPAATFRAQLGIVSELRGFLFEIRSKVVSYQFQMKKRGSPDLIGPIKVNSPYLNDPAIKTYIDGARAGDKVYFEEIRAFVPDGGPARPVNPIIFTLI